MLSDKLNIFDFIAFLLKELGSEADRRYSGLQTLSYVPAPDYIAFVNHFIADIRNYYSSQNKDYFHYIVTEDFPKRFFNNYLENTSFRENKDAVFELAKTICREFFNKENIRTASEKAYHLEQAFNHKNGFSQLNSNQNAEETGYLLLPDLGTFGDENKLNKTTTTFEKILLKGIIVVKSSDLKTRNGQTYQIRNIVPMSYSHMNTHPDDGVLKIAVSPICDKWLLNDQPIVKTLENGTKEYCFTSEGITDEQFVHSRVVTAYQESCICKSHLLVFPEMYGTETLSLNAKTAINIFEQETAPLVVMPSWWHENKNTSFIQDDSLTTVFSQNKFSSFLCHAQTPKYPVASLEDLHNTDHLVYIYHIPEIGRICVCICKDFLMDSYRRMLTESLEASIILIPAFTPAIEHFTNCMGELKHAGSYGVFINCCAALCNKDDVPTSITGNQAIGAVSITKAVANDYDPPFRLLYPQCQGDCNGSQTCCLFIIKITNDGSVSIDHIYRRAAE